jgi:regulation of enolase protein 1 (concanavalin A-like superfamily)
MKRKINPIVELGGSLWIIADWAPWVEAATKKPTSVLLQRLTRHEEALAANWSTDYECWSMVITQIKKRLAKERQKNAGQAPDLSDASDV